MNYQASESHDWLDLLEGQFPRSSDVCDVRHPMTVTITPDTVQVGFDSYPVEPTRASTAYRWDSGRFAHTLPS